MDFNTRMRIWHRYLGFFFAGIMAMYAISGIVLIFRDTNFLKSEKIERRAIEPGLADDALGKQLRKRELRIEKTEGDIVYFRDGSYNRVSGVAEMKRNELP